MVTPEMLLFLAGKLNLPNYAIVDGNVVYTLEQFNHLRPGYYEPHKDDAQFGRLVVWAAMQGHDTTIGMSRVFVSTGFKLEQGYFKEHDSTPDSIRAAAVVAICRALGHEGEKE